MDADHRRPGGFLPGAKFAFVKSLIEELVLVFHKISLPCAGPPSPRLCTRSRSALTGRGRRRHKGDAKNVCIARRDGGRGISSRYAHMPIVVNISSPPATPA